MFSYLYFNRKKIGRQLSEAPFPLRPSLSEQTILPSDLTTPTALYRSIKSLKLCEL